MASRCATANAPANLCRTRSRHDRRHDTFPDHPTCPNVFEAGLPIVAYDQLDDPEQAHRLIAAARSRAPIAIGTHGPEILRYELVHTVLRDPRFRMPKGMFLAGQGITSGAIWDRVTASLISLDGEEHHRLRRLVSKAFTPRATARLRTTVVDVITELVDRQTVRGRCDVVTDIARQYPIPIICALLGAPARGLGTVLGMDRRHLQGIQLERRRPIGLHPGGMGGHRRLRRRYGR